MAYRLRWWHLLIFWAHPFYPHHHCMGVLHHAGMHLSGPATATWDTMLGLSFLYPLSLKSRIAKLDKYLRSDHWHLQEAGGRALTIRDGSQELSCQVKTGLHHRFQKTFSDIIGNWIMAIQSQMKRRNLLNWCLFLPGSQQQSIKHGVIITWKAVKDNSAATWNNN